MEKEESRSIVIIEEKGSVRDRVFFAIENSTLIFQTHHFFRWQEATEFINGRNHIDLIIVGKLTDPESFPKFLDHLEKKNIKTPQMIFTENEFLNYEDRIYKINSNSKILSFKIKQGKFEESLNEMLMENRVGATSSDKFEFKKIKIIYFLRFNKALCDVYVKLSDDKFVKMINAGDPYNREFIYKFTNKRVKHLYIKNEDYEDFSVSALKTPFLILSEDGAHMDTMDLCSSTVEVIHDLIKDVGVSPQVIELVDALANKVESDINRKSQLRGLVTNLKNRRDYLYDHSVLVAYVSIAICKEMEWDSDTTRIKLTYGSILHDVLIDDPELAFNYDLGLDGISKYSKEQIENYKTHSELTAKLISECNRLPPNIDKIVLQHHERPNGTGFPRGLSATNISKLSGIFNLSHEFVNELYLNEFQQDKIPAILNKLEISFSKGNYRDAVKGIRAALGVK